MNPFQRYGWYAQAFIKKYKTIMIVSAGIGLTAFLFLPSFFSAIALGKPTLYIGRVGTFPLSKLPRNIQDLVSFGLTRVDETGQAVPGLASSFRVEDDGKSYRFTILPKAYWQDGKLVTTQDIQYNFTDIDTIRSPGDIIYRLNNPNVDPNSSTNFLPSSFPVIVSQPLFRQVTTKSFFFFTKTSIYGLGAYQISQIQYNGSGISQLTLESNTERRVYRFYTTEHDAIVAFKQGEVDQLEEMQNLEDLATWKTVDKFLTPKNDKYVGIFFNTTYQTGDDRPYNNKNVRTALNFAIQKQQGADRILSPIYKGSWAYVANEDDLDHFDQDMNQAADNYLKAQYFVPLHIELTTIPSYADKADTLKQNWEDLGKLARQRCQSQNLSPNCGQIAIDVTIRITNVPDLSNYQVLLVGQQIPLDPDQYSLWHSTEPTNFTHYKNARIDKLLEDGRKLTDKDERKLIYQEFQQLLVKESPVIFLEPIKTYTVQRKNLF